MPDVATLVRPSPAEVKRYSGKSIKEIIANRAPKPKQILGEGVLIKGSRACVYADPKAAKSLLVMQMGLCCASGIEFLGISVIHKVNVFYINFELDEYMVEQRILAIKDKLGLDEVPKFRELTLLGEDVPQLDTQDGFKQVTDILTEKESDGFPVDLLIWDCRYKTFNHSENEDDVMKKWIRNMEELAKVFEFTPLIVHHKGKKTLGVGAGSNVFDRWVNTAIEIKPRWSQGLKHSPERKIIVNGNYTSGHEVNTMLDYPIHQVGGDEAWQKPLSRKEQAMNFIMAELQAGAIKQEELEEKAIAEGHTRSTFFEAKGELEKKGLIYTKPDTTKAGRHNVVELLSPPLEG